MAMMLLSLGVSVLCYAISLDFFLAVGLVILLFVHEIGHVIAARVVGLRTSPPIFIPFLGALVRLKHQPYNAKMAANIAIGGPALGTVSALLCLALYFWTMQHKFLILAYVASMMNLFNLIPSEPMDGGQIVLAISPYLWWGGTVILAIVQWYTRNIIIFVILLFSLWRLVQLQFMGTNSYYYQLSIKQRILVLTWYLGLVVVLSLNLLHIHLLLRL